MSYANQRGNIVADIQWARRQSPGNSMAALIFQARRQWLCDMARLRNR